MLTLLALGLGITIAELMMPLFNELSGTELAISFSMAAIAVMLVAAVVVSLIAGIYPALILSGFRPVEVLKGRLKLSGDKSLFRQSMVVFQFALSIALITGTLIVRKQLNYIQQKDLGYQEEQMLVLESGYNPGFGEQQETIIKSIQRKKLLLNNLGTGVGIHNATVSAFTPVQMAGWFRLGFRDRQDQQHSFHGNIVDEEFIPTLGISVIQGRNFSEDNPADRTGAIIVNRAMVEHFGWEEPIGKRLPGPEFESHEVIGVVENFHYESLHTPVEPLALAMSSDLLFSGVNNMSLSNSSAPRLTFNIQSDNLTATMDQLRAAWNEVAPASPFEFTFIDQVLDGQYRQEQKLSRVVTSGSMLAMIIACMGLFGLASLMVVRRTKEIGVRKVLGASAKGILLLINKEFTKLVGIAFLIATPVTWYIMRQWLKDFAYQMELGPGIFLAAGTLVILVAWLTVSYQSFRAARINPVESLRSD